MCRKSYGQKPPGNDNPVVWGKLLYIFSCCHTYIPEGPVVYTAAYGPSVCERMNIFAHTLAYTDICYG